MIRSDIGHRTVSGRWRPEDVNSPIVIPSPTLPPTPQQRRKSTTTGACVADDALPAGLVSKGYDHTTPFLASRSPLSALEMPSFPTPRPTMDQFDKQIKPRHGVTTPVVSSRADAVRALLSNEQCKKALFDDIRRIIADTALKKGSTDVHNGPALTPPHNGPHPSFPSEPDLLQRLARIVCAKAGDPAPTFASVDKEIASLVSVSKPQHVDATLMEPTAAPIRTPKPSGHLVARDIELLQKRYPNPKRIQRSTNSAFSESTPDTTDNHQRVRMTRQLTV